MSLYITEFRNLARDGEEYLIPIPIEPCVAEQKLAITELSVQSATFDAATRIVRIHASEPCHIAVGSNPTASHTNRRLPKDIVEYISIVPESAFKIAVITSPE